jgi:metal-responsive CopG/Arc/MetJ family transcriptional regulator
VKTAISIPDDTFDRASKRATELGVSRSEFFTRAAQQYLKHLDASSVTAQIDRTLAVAGDDDSSTAAAQAGRRRLARETEW